MILSAARGRGFKVVVWLNEWLGRGVAAFVSRAAIGSGSTPAAIESAYCSIIATWFAWSQSASGVLLLCQVDDEADVMASDSR